MEPYYATEYLLKQRQREIEQQARQAWKWFSLPSKQKRARLEPRMDANKASPASRNESMEISRD